MTFPGSPKSIVLIAALFISLVSCADAHDQADFIRSISVTGQGEASGTPDQAQVTAGVQTLAPTVTEASRQNQQVVARIMQALAKEGIDEKDIQTVNYSIWPEQKRDRNGAGEVTIVGYRVSNNVNVTVNDIDTIGPVLAAITDAGANTIQGINFRMKDTAVLERQAREAAMANARERAEALAELAGVELGDVLTVSMSSDRGYPVPIMRGRDMALAEASVPSFSPGQLDVSMQVYVSYSIR